MPQSIAVKAAISLIFGLCIPFSLAPFNIWPLSVIGIMGFFWLQSTTDHAKQAFWLGWVYGLGFFGLGVSWVYGSMTTVGTSVPLSLLMTAAFCMAMALFSAVQLWFHVRFLNQLRFALILASPLSWVFFEWLREWFLTGMPWLYVGYAVIDLPIAQLAAVFSVYGLSLLLAFIAAGLVIAIKRLLSKEHKQAIITFGISCLAFAVLNILGFLAPADSWTSAQSTLSVAAIQSNIPQQDKWKTSQQLATLEFYGKQIETLKDVDLMLWPEAAMTRRAEQIPNFISQVQNITQNRDQTLLTGVVNKDGERYFNSIQGYGMAKGEEYRKQHLVPFGEYVPFDPHLRNLIGFFNISISGMSPALTQQRPITSTLNTQPYFIAPVICYEAAYPNIVRQLAKDAQIITVVSNDAWFGDSIAPHQHLQITRMRAIENGRDMARSTQNGISALINARGEVIEQSEQFTEARVIGDLTLRNGLTPFQRFHGSLVPMIATVGLLLMLIIGYQKRRKTDIEEI